MSLSCSFAIFPQLYNSVVTKPSRVGEAFLIVFGLFFLVFGIFGASAFYFNPPSHVQGSRLAGVLVPLFFALIGGGIICASIYGTRKLKEQAAVEQSHPESPWLWRKDWAASRAESKNRNGVWGLWIAALFGNTIALTLAVSTLPALWRSSDPKAFFPLLFCVAGFILAGAAIRSSIRRKRFGLTYFEFSSLPFSPGRTLKGTVHLHFNTDAKHGIDLRLSCVRQTVTGSGNNRSTQQSVLWQADKNVPRESLMPGPSGDAMIPVEFGIPSDAYESNHDQPTDQVLWLLHAEADIPGVNYSDDFEVPVFRLTPLPAAAAEQTGAFRSEAQDADIPPAFLSDASDVPAPAHPKVQVSAAPNGGTQFYFRPFRNPVQVLVLILVTAVWTGVVYFLAHSKAPGFFAPVFGLFDLVLMYGLMQTATGSSRIEVGNGRVFLRRALMSIGQTREIPFSDIAQILVATSAQQGTQPSYSLRLLTRDGKKLTLADMIGDRQEARWVAAQLEKSIGLKLDTHVSVDPILGAGGPPPQRGKAPMGLRRNSPVAIAVGFAFFFAWTGFVVYRGFFKGHGPRPRVSKVSQPAKSPLQQVTYAPLTDADLQHLQTLPQQAEAEELLDRAIQHDERALGLFEENIGVWRGIKPSARMSELERRSRFSTDLRVRYANADLNLAMDGWPKTESSANQLIAQAEGDPEHRPYSVYHLGMLAGRGVAYARIYPVLVHYAKNDANPQVRQWAVEGMRYLGTDEALDELFDSFTHDPSLAVRDRAGCNVSDCGNFTRKQRMRMVPKLIELAADRETTPQMRNWAFLALGEITSVTLPADATAWRDWNAQHGNDKMAEFEESDWWKVVGDQ
jgi:hypothetical protein